MNWLNPATKRCSGLPTPIDAPEAIEDWLSERAGRRVHVSVPQRGERKDLVNHALANAREALGRKLAETSSQQRLLKAMTETFGSTCHGAGRVMSRGAAIRVRADATFEYSETPQRFTARTRNS